MEPGSADITPTGTINGIGKGHVVGRNRLRHGAGSSAYGKESTGDILARTDLRESAIDARLHVNLKSLLLNLQFGLGHTDIVAPQPGLGQYRDFQ